MEENELDKSEQATPFKLKRAREKGTVARGIDLGFFASMLALLGYAWTSGLSATVELSHLATLSFRGASTANGDGHALLAQVSMLFAAVVWPLLVFAGTAFAVALLFEFMQVGAIFSVQPLKPDFKRINPVQGLKRIFSWRLLIEAFKSLIKLGVYGAITWLVVEAALSSASYSAFDGKRLVAALGTSGFDLLLYFTVAALFVAALDQIWSRREFAKKMRMSRRELKREHRDREGDPRFKQKRQEFHKEFMNMAKSLRGARDADVILTNPTHYAVALRYDPKVMSAPRLVSRGRGALAARIRQIGFIYGVTIHRDPALARALFQSAAVDTEIPDSLYHEVAEIYRQFGLAGSRQE